MTVYIATAWVLARSTLWRLYRRIYFKMTVYVFDTSSFSQLFGSYYRSVFPTLWALFGEMVSTGRLVTVREVKNEIERYPGTKLETLTGWCASHQELFTTPSPQEQSHVASIFHNSHFLQLVTQKALLKGTPVADHFVIAKAGEIGGCVVTEEADRPNAAKIPNVCEHFRVDYTDLEGFMERERWQF